MHCRSNKVDILRVLWSFGRGDLLPRHARWLTWNLRPLTTMTLSMQSCSIGTVDMRLLQTTMAVLRSVHAFAMDLKRKQVAAQHPDKTWYIASTPALKWVLQDDQLAMESDEYIWQ